MTEGLKTDRIDEAVLALLHLNICERSRFGGARAWKPLDWGAMHRLHESGPHLRSGDQGEIGSSEQRGLGPGGSCLPTAVQGRCLTGRGVAIQPPARGEPGASIARPGWRRSGFGNDPFHPAPHLEFDRQLCHQTGHQA